eukprot:NODE_660_length_1283_cov_59.242215_g621_i0.p1 GENE.NODE_660_length_1283_cov_59.242215_g621_i0~~NODE_660_length_1283_cov_59.242215_g621_i0.p1  ORF type:complete len:377 (+),score=67.81 NODE_660_length_1283_cov_59.242215_g621_i0:78-1208(+)
MKTQVLSLLLAAGSSLATTVLEFYDEGVYDSGFLFYQSMDTYRSRFRTFIELDETNDDQLIRYGFYAPDPQEMIDDGFFPALDDIPTGAPSAGFVAAMSFGVEAAQAGVPHKFVQMNYNPNGHPGVNQWLVSHYDIHFHFQSPRPVLAVECQTFECELTDFSMIADERFFPDNFVCISAFVAQMGIHCLDVSIPPDFSNTPALIYGTWGGIRTFDEPMVSNNVYTTIRNSGKQCWTWPRPSGGVYPEQGWFGDMFCVEWDDTESHFIHSFENLFHSDPVYDDTTPVYGGDTVDTLFATAEAPVSSRQDCLIANDASDIFDGGFQVTIPATNTVCCRGKAALVNGQCLVGCNSDPFTGDFVTSMDGNSCYMHCMERV